jgi:pyridinium-3,5-biscarboxylic acid mononucleotide synthase
MTPDDLALLLQRVAGGVVSAEDALERLRRLPFEDVEGARIDHHRELRTGAPEVIYGAGKTTEQVTRIALAILEAGGNVLVTRTDAAAHAALLERAADARWHPVARTITVVRKPPAALGTVGILCAGTSDLPVAEEAAVCAGFFGAEVVRLTDVGVAGLHRLLAAKAQLDRMDVVIVIAGMEGALPSVVGGLVGRPVIAVPTSVGYGAAFGGIAALLGMLNSCATGVTVVNIDNGFGAAAAANRILRGRT